ncbi:hypothetical protein ncot_07265 [Nocardioides sp. JQ2195]|uniref:hypothetical protein n=1 Tax=Nocardioides sp. JQ2195 TaxID=2592334 RepID=UPI00143EBAA7|nr:hypothetical protein [Nocardioides sp. JQ2195]QIX26422.1 hypothetical protein ncot_07265 [Nocardioides sp. JQ2195]
MNITFALILALATLGYLAYLAALIHNDGFGHRAPRNPPRSHHADAFERHAFLS